RRHPSRLWRKPRVVKQSRCSWLRRSSKGGKYESVSSPFSQVNRLRLSGPGRSPGFSCPHRRGPASVQRQSDGGGFSTGRDGRLERRNPVERPSVLHITAEH